MNQSGQNWTVANIDCVAGMKQLPDCSIGMAGYSPPYMGLYIYNASPNDLGNCTNDDEFHAHYKFVIDEVYRVLKPGRVVAVDCMNVPAMKERDGYIGIKDFRGELIRRHVDAGFIFHSEVFMWKDPLIEATRTKALGLMHKQLCKDSAMSRMGLAQYILAFRKPGENPEPIPHQDGLMEFAGLNPPTSGNLSHENWRRYASPAWMDINWTRTLNVIQARDERDERHVCPMALDAIHRCVQLWSNPGDVVLDPFTGIGSTGYEAVKMGRKFVGFELKTSYFREAVKNLKAAEDSLGERDLFSDFDADDETADQPELATA